MLALQANWLAGSTTEMFTLTFKWLEIVLYNSEDTILLATLYGCMVFD